MNFTQDFPFVGTTKAFIDHKIHLNGKALDAIAIGALARHGLIEDVGAGTKPARGRTPRMYKVYSHGTMQFTASDAPIVQVAQTNAVDAQMGVDTGTQV